MQLSVKEAARLLAVSESTIFRWIEQHRLPAAGNDGQARFDRSELIAWATARDLQLALDPLPSLWSALDAGGVHFGVGGRHKAAALASALDAMPLPGELDRGALLERLLAREAAGSTGVGDGIAIPHVRDPGASGLQQPRIALCFLEQPVDFGALDGKPVRVLFTMLSPTVPVHLHLLSHLTYALRVPAFRAALRARTSREELLAAAEQAEAELARSAASRLRRG